IGTSEAENATAQAALNSGSYGRADLVNRGSTPLAALHCPAAEVELCATPPMAQTRSLSEAGSAIGAHGYRAIEEALKPSKYLLPPGYEKQIRDGAARKEIKPLSDASQSMGAPLKASPEDVGKTHILLLSPS